MGYCKSGTRSCAWAILAAILVVAEPAAEAREPAADGNAGLGHIARIDGFWQAALLLEGGESRAVTHSPVDKLSCSWFPENGGLLVTTADGDLIRVDPAAEEEVAIDVGVTGIVDAVVSHGGEQIAFAFSSGDSRDGHDIWIANGDGGDPRRVTWLPGLQHGPAWTPDDRSIYFLSGVVGQSHDIWRVPAIDKKPPQRLTIGALYHFDVAVSRGGVLAYSNNRTGTYQIWRQEPPSPAVQLTKGPGFRGRPAWSADGGSVIYEEIDEHGILNLWRVAAEGGSPEPVTQRADGARAPCGWPRRAS